MENLLKNLMRNWEICLKKHSELFRFKLNIEKSKVLDGYFGFYVEVCLNFPQIFEALMFIIAVE
jgi:hypothetical protein